MPGLVPGISLAIARLCQPKRDGRDKRDHDDVVRPMLTRRDTLLGLLSAPLWSRASFAQTYPNRAVRIVVPFSAGAPDTVARIIGQQLSVQLGQPVVIENRPGANGVTGTNEVVKAPPDGHTLLVVSSSFAVNPSIYRKLPYDPLADLEPITSICATEGYILVVHPSAAAKSVQELVTLSRNGANKLAYGSPGVGNTLHLAGALLNARAGIDMAHVPYRGAGPAITDLLGGQIQVMFVTTPLGLQHIQAGRLPLAYTNAKRASFLPDVPTMEEAGFPGFVLDGGWYGLFAPARTPPDIVARLHREVAGALTTSEVRERFAPLALDPIGSPPAAFRPFVAGQIAMFGELVRLAKIEPQ
jgi:tripartite-type tricarboxylate transporter receptor subunit TctC